MGKVEVEVKELTCSEAGVYYEGYLLRILSEAMDKAVLKHLAKCKNCHDDYLKWAKPKFKELRERINTLLKRKR